MAAGEICKLSVAASEEEDLIPTVQIRWPLPPGRLVFSDSQHLLLCFVVLYFVFLFSRFTVGHTAELGIEMVNQLSDYNGS